MIAVACKINLFVYPFAVSLHRNKIRMSAKDSGTFGERLFGAMIAMRLRLWSPQSPRLITRIG